MSENNFEEIFKTIADAYVDQYAEELKAEYIEIKDQCLTYITPKLDGRIKNILRSKGSSHNRVFQVIAASIVLLLLIPGIIGLMKLRQLNKGDTYSSSNDSVYTSPSAGADQGYGLDELNEPIYEETYTGDNNEMVLLQLSLPDKYVIQYSQLDNNQTIHYITSQNLDNIVTTIEYDIGNDWYKDFSVVDINGLKGYYRNSDDYKMIVFVKDEHIYTVTCRFDMETIYDFVKYI